MANYRKNLINKQNKVQPNYSGTEELIDNEKSLKNYSSHIIKLILKNKQLHPQSKVLEFGAGTGFLMKIFHDKTSIKPEGVEIDPKLVQEIRKNGFKCFTSTEELASKYDLIYTSNVLEHIEDDVEALKKISFKLLPSGILVVYVPALPWLYSELDAKVGHFRRYRKKELTKKLIAAGYQVQEIRYVDSIGVLAALLTKIIGYKNKAGLGSKSSLTLYDKVIFPFSKFVDILGGKAIIGKNLLVVASHKGSIGKDKAS